MIKSTAIGRSPSKERGSQLLVLQVVLGLSTDGAETELQRIEQLTVGEALDEGKRHWKSSEGVGEVRHGVLAGLLFSKVRDVCAAAGDHFVVLQ